MSILSGHHLFYILIHSLYLMVTIKAEASNILLLNTLNLPCVHYFKHVFRKESTKVVNARLLNV